MSDTKQEFLDQAKPLAQSLLDYATSADAQQYNISDAKVSVSLRDEVDIGVEKGRVSASRSGKSVNVAIQLYAGDQSLSFSSNSLDEGQLKASMLENMQAIHLAPENPDSALIDPALIYKGPQKDFDTFDASSVDDTVLAQYAIDLEAAALSAPGVKDTPAVEISKSASHQYIQATNGLEIYVNGTNYRATGQVVAEDDNGMEIGSESSISAHFSDMACPKRIGRLAAENAISKLSSSLPQTGSMPIILSPSAASTLIGSVFTAIDGTSIHQERSFWRDKVGQQVMNKGVTIMDDPTIPRGLASGAIDSAGMKQDPITFIEDGVLKSYNVGLKEARQLGIDPIGRNSGPTNVLVLPGDKTPDELMADISEGIYVEGFNGGTADVNNGTHSRQAYGHIIKDGKITKDAVSGFVVAGNLQDMFMSMVLANDTPQLPHPMHTTSIPTIRLDGLTISGGM